MTDKRNRILVVDDLSDWRETLGGLLIDEGYEVETAESVARTLALLGTRGFDLAVIDVRLDEADEDNTEGLDLAAEIRSRWPEVKVIIITGYGAPDIVKRAMEPDAQGRRLVADYLPKTDAGQLIQVVQRVLVQ